MRNAFEQMVELAERLKATPMIKQIQAGPVAMNWLRNNAFPEPGLLNGLGVDVLLDSRIPQELFLLVFTDGSLRAFNTETGKGFEIPPADSPLFRRGRSSE